MNEQLKAQLTKENHGDDWIDFSDFLEEREPQSNLTQNALNQLLFAFKQESCCSFCGCNNPYAIQFHHIKPKEKMSIVSKTYSPALLICEVEKCALLCANCHMTFHHCKDARVRRSIIDSMKPIDLIHFLEVYQLIIGQIPEGWEEHRFDYVLKNAPEGSELLFGTPIVIWR